MSNPMIEWKQRRTRGGHRATGTRFASVLALVLLAFGMAPTLAGAESAPSPTAPGSNQAATPAEQLMLAYTPIVMVKQQRFDCDERGEAFLPSPVDVVLDDPQVQLRERTGAGADPVIMDQPAMADIAAREERYYLDFPGNSRNPGCGFERWFKARVAETGMVPTTYGNVVVDAERNRVILQFWFWYVFNDFNNTHEGDWEMIQIVWDAASVEEALTEEPLETGFSQHSGGERSDWTDEKLEKEGTHPVVYAAAGSHASNYGSEVYLAWGEDSTGFGCDVTTGPSNRLEMQAILVEGGTANVSGPLAWASFEGRWGERQRAFYNGPHGPAVRERWVDPMPWQERLRETSLIVPAASTLGPGPTDIFCQATAYMSLALTRVAVYPLAVVGIIAVLIGGLVLLINLGGGTIAQAWGLFLRRWPTFVLLGLLLVPVGIIANLVQNWVVGHSPGRQLFQLMNESPGARLAFVLTIGGLQQIISLIVVGPAVIEAVDELLARREGSFTSAFRRLGRDLRRLLKALLRPAVIITLLSISVVGIPWAIGKTVRWWFVAQAVILDGAEPREARRVSERLVAGRWWRTAAACLLLTLLAVAAGPAMGIFLLVVASPSIQYINVLSSVIYSIMIPLAVIGSTVLYLNLKRTRGGSPATTEEVPLAAADALSEPVM